MSGFHEVRFPLDVSTQARGGPERMTEIVVTSSGREQRNARRAHARRRYEAGYGVKSAAALSQVLAFFEERRGRLYGFRWRDRSDYKSCAPMQDVSPLDQTIGTGDGATRGFPLVKTYGQDFAPYQRRIVKPVAGSVRIAVAGVELDKSFFDVDGTTGLVTFRADHVPPQGAVVTAGYLFDVPVRFDTDYLEIDYAAFGTGGIPKIPLIEILL
ncbi:MAG: hypothetical protein RIQ68_1647 [Pseudomonadota bacterium]